MVSINRKRLIEWMNSLEHNYLPCGYYRGVKWRLYAFSVIGVEIRQCVYTFLFIDSDGLTWKSTTIQDAIYDPIDHVKQVIDYHYKQ